MTIKFSAKEISLLITFLSILLLDFFQPLLPLPVFALTGILATLLFILLYLDRILNNNSTETSAIAFGYIIITIALSLGAIAVQTDNKKLQHSGLLAGHMPFLASLQSALINHKSNANAQTITKSTRTERLNALPDAKYKAEQVSVAQIVRRSLEFQNRKTENYSAANTESPIAPVDKIISENTFSGKSDNSGNNPNARGYDYLSTVNPDMKGTDYHAASQQLGIDGINWNPKEFYKASSEGNLKVMGLFLKGGMSVETQLDDIKQSVIVSLIQRNPEATLKSLQFLQSNGIDLNKKYKVYYAESSRIPPIKRYTLLELAVMNLNTEVVKFLKETGVPSDNAVNLIANDVTSSSVKAKISQIQEIYLTLTGKNFVPNNITNLNQKLIDAMDACNVSLMEFYLLSGAKPNFITKKNKPAFLLFKAAKTARAEEIVDLLIKYDANVNQRSPTGRTPLFIHTQMNRYNAVKSLLAARANPNIQAKDGTTTIYTAARENRMAILRLLLKAGAKVNLALRNGNSPLMIASLNGHQEIVELLLEHGANTGLRDKKGLAPLDYANVNGHQEIISLLSQKPNSLPQPLTR